MKMTIMRNLFLSLIALFLIGCNSEPEGEKVYFNEDIIQKLTKLKDEYKIHSYEINSRYAFFDSIEATYRQEIHETSEDMRYVTIRCFMNEKESNCYMDKSHMQQITFERASLALNNSLDEVIEHLEQKAKILSTYTNKMDGK